MQNSETYLKNIDVDKIHELEDTVEILTEQIVSLKLELSCKNQELSELAEELNFTNQELCSANELFTNTFASLPMKEAKKLNNNLLAGKKPAKSNLFSPTDFKQVGV